MTFKIGDRVVIKSYTPELYNTLGIVFEGETFVGKNGTIVAVYDENEEKIPEGFQVKFNVKNNENDYDWFFIESDIQLISEYEKVQEEQKSVVLSINDFNFLINEFNIDTTNGAKYTRLLKHFAKQ